MNKYEIKIPMCLVGVVNAKNKRDAIEIALNDFDVKNTTCEFWDIVEPQASEIKKSEYDTVKDILIKHDVLHKDIDQLDDPILMQDLYEHFQEQMPYGTQKARTGDPDEFIYDALENLELPLGEQQL